MYIVSKVKSECERKMQADSANKTITFRHATIDDARGIALVHVDTWRTTYAGIVPDEFLRNLSYDRRERQWQSFYAKPEPRSHLWIALDGDKIIGFSSGGHEQNAEEHEGEVYAIYLLSSYHGRGIGKELFQRSFAHLRVDGFTSVIVWALADNPTCNFYRKMGGLEYSEKMEDIGGVSLKEISFRWSRIESGILHL